MNPIHLVEIDGLFVQLLRDRTAPDCTVLCLTVSMLPQESPVLEAFPTPTGEAKNPGFQIWVQCQAAGPSGKGWQWGVLLERGTQAQTRLTGSHSWYLFTASDFE